MLVPKNRKRIGMVPIKNKLSKIDKELDKLAEVVKSCLDIKKIERLIK